MLNIHKLQFIIKDFPSHLRMYRDGDSILFYLDEIPDIKTKEKPAKSFMTRESRIEEIL